MLTARGSSIKTCMLSLVVCSLAAFASKVDAQIDLTTGDECFSRSGDYDCYYSLPLKLETRDDEETEQKWPNEFVPTARLNLPIKQLRKTFEPYAAFCRRSPGECDLSGRAVIALSGDTMALLTKVNRAVNNEIACSFDIFEFNEEEYWAYPVNERGDCEDIALEKRRRLVGLSIPRGALRIALVQQRVSLYAHAVLTVETTVGTYILDEDNDGITLWYLTQYNFETRERPDGRWERFDQEIWWY